MKYLIVNQFFRLLAQYGIRYIICSPGSRNAALLEMANSVMADAIKLVVIDERSAAFVALGMAVASHSPVALICTSGSAVLNYGPAVAEAYYQGIPLIVISADRPEEWIDQDDSQTIHQVGTFSGYIKAVYDIDAQRTGQDYLWYINRIVNEGMMRALSMKKGPVHFNIRLDGKPLVPHTNAIVPCRKIQLLLPKPKPSKDLVRSLAVFAANKKVMVVAGFYPPNADLQKALQSIERLPNVCVMAETVSNLHLPWECYMIDKVLFSLSSRLDDRSFLPDVVIFFGGALISRKLKEFLRSCTPEKAIYVGFSENVIDCFKNLTDKIECDPVAFFKPFVKKLEIMVEKKLSSPVYEYRQLWNTLRHQYKMELNHIAWSDLKAMDIILNALPYKTNLFLSNGTSIRYAQIVPHTPPHATFGNRGVSGIDGCTSTAIGVSLVYPGLTCIISGDMSLAYDFGILASGLPGANLRIVVLDNGGGDIFRYIKDTRELDIRERFLCADPHLPLKSIAEAFGMDYYYASSEEELNNIINKFFALSSAPAILHLDTRNSDNSNILINNLN